MNSPLFIKRVFPPIFEKNLTVLLYGPRSQGKSLHQAKLARKIFIYLDQLYAKFQNLPQAIIVSNQMFSKEFGEKYTAPREISRRIGKGIHYERRLYYWENIRQLHACPRENCWKAVPRMDKQTNKVTTEHHLHDAYILFDDIATIIPADGWQMLPKWFRKMFAQAGHNGVHCIANIQDPVSCDINFRRYVDVALKFKKVMGNRRPEEAKPKINFVWGLYITRQISAEELYAHGDRTEEEIKLLKKENPELNRHNWNVSFGLITKKITNIFDTSQNVPEWMPDKLEHRVLTCEDPECDVEKVVHKPI